MQTRSWSNPAEECEQLAEVDCPWFDPIWVLDNPDFPLAASLASESNSSKKE